MDETGARVHLANLDVPVSIIKLELEIDEIRLKKNKVVKLQNFEEAARLRDKEKSMTLDLETAKEEWEVKASETYFPVSVNDISDVVAMMTGVPVNKIADSETSRLMSMPDDLKKIVVGQDEAITQVVKATDGQGPDSKILSVRLGRLCSSVRRVSEKPNLQKLWRELCLIPKML
jgi:ATP-dependent Clp protease ATP-binding subunit ClpC